MTTTLEREIGLEPVERLTRDMVLASRVLTPDEARYLVDSFYTFQDYRKASANQVRALTDGGEPCQAVAWLLGQTENMEGQVKRVLDAWSEGQAAGVWAKSIYGIGPVLTAGLLANIDIAKAPTVGHIWRFAGLDPTQKWEPKTKRPWNADLKTLCWKIGQSFMKFHNRDECFYGHLYAERKALIVGQNDAGKFAETAARELAEKRIGKDTEAHKHYTEGKLPPGRVDARARRWVVKLFLAHFHEVLYFSRFEKMPVRPYVFDHMGHSDEIGPPNAHLVAGLVEARRRR